MAEILRPGERIIDDNSPENFFNPAGVRKGFEGMYRRGFSNARYAALPDRMLIDKSEWRDRIAAKQKDNAQVSDLLIYKNLPPKNQSSSSLCWYTAPTGGYEAQRVIMNQPYIEFSNGYGAGRITGGKDRGGWADDALDDMENHGLCPTKYCPNNQAGLDKKYRTPENAKHASENRITDGWWKLEPGYMEQVASLLLQNIIVCIGYDWWRHEIYACDLLWDGKEFMFRIRNSWGDIPEFPNGFGVLKGRKMIPSDAVAFRQVSV